MDILVVGASVRAAVGSLLRIGCRPVACDLFADADLAAACPATRIAAADYPDRLWDWVGHLPPMPWIYTGALENHPDVVAHLSQRFRLLGNGPIALRAVRDPVRLASVVRRAGFAVPMIRTDPATVPRDGTWLRKPVGSGGGEGINPFVGSESAVSGPVVYQERIRGISCSATFVRGRAEVCLVGVTRQYHGRAGNRFAYRGSLGPWEFEAAVADQVAGMGRVVGDSFDLRGLFGIDLIVADGRAWLIEVNPRYTAAVEVLERAGGRSILADHLAAFDLDTGIGDQSSFPEPRARVVAKSILFARSAGRLIAAVPVHPEPFPRVADIPQPETRFETGDPIMTVFGQGETVAHCRRDLVRQLRHRRRQLDEVLKPEY